MNDSKRGIFSSSTQESAKAFRDGMNLLNRVKAEVTLLRDDFVIIACSFLSGALNLTTGSHLAAGMSFAVGGLWLGLATYRTKRMFAALNRYNASNGINHSHPS